MADKVRSSNYHRDSPLFMPERDLGPIDRPRGTRLYTLILIVGKLLYVLGLFVSFGILKNISIIQFLFFVKACSAAGYISLQQPLSTGVRLTKTQWKSIVAFGICSALLNLLWLDGLTLCGPLRTVLLTQHSDAVVLSVVGVLLHRATSFPSKVRGTSFFAIAILCLLLFDNDEQYMVHPEGSHHGTILHFLYQMFSWLGLPDHNGGILVLLLFITLRIFYNSAFRRFAVDIGGMKRLQALTNLVEACVLFPWALYTYLQDEMNYSIPFLYGSVFVVTIASFIGHFYIESVCSAKMDSHRANNVGSSAAFVGAILWSFVWDNVLRIGKEGLFFRGHEHWTSAGAIFCGFFFVIATRLLTHPVPVKQSAGNRILIGYTDTGIPLYSYSAPAGHTPQAITLTIKQLLRQILEEQDSRNIFFYLCLNLMFTGVELLYGVWTNSLGLISDGFHMLFDCSALVLGLSAAVMSRWKASKTFSYGYGRVEVLSGFINGLFLVVIAFFVFIAALERLIDPPEVRTEKLLAVSVAGLLVNLVGILAFSHAHSHGHGKPCGGDSHNHSHSHHSHSHHHGHGHGHGHEHAPRNSNMQGVFLHVVADTLGSIGVIVSSLLIQQFGWNIADPICSLFIAVMIFASVIPLLRYSSMILLLRMPADIEGEVMDGLSKILSIDGVLSYREVHVWQHSADVIAGTIHVQVMPPSNEHKITQQVTGILRDCGINNLYVQVEKVAFYQHLSQFSARRGGGFSFLPFANDTVGFQSVKSV